MTGLSWFALLVIARPEPSCTSQAQPEPKRFTPASFSWLLKSSKLPNVSESAWARSPSGSPPPSGPMICQKKEWFEWPPALLRTAPRLSSGTLSRFFSTSSTGLSAHSVPSSAALALVTYAA